MAGYFRTRAIFCIAGGGQGPQKQAVIIRAAQIQSQPVNAPTEDSAHSTEQAAGAVDVKNDGKAGYSLSDRQCTQ